jgi:hypothetical protein
MDMPASRGERTLMRGFLLSSLYGVVLAVAWWFIAHSLYVSLGTMLSAVALTSWRRYANEGDRVEVLVLISLVYGVTNLYINGVKPF